MTNRSMNFKGDWVRRDGRLDAGLKINEGAKEDKGCVLLVPNESSLEVSIKLPPISSLESREFNWKVLLKEKEKKLGQSEEIIEISDDDDDVNSDRKKRRDRRKPDQDNEYDLEDSFIDDMENHDENVPDEATTELGGFYINRGSLNLKNNKLFE